jgi:hypothetical protein
VKKKVVSGVPMIDKRDRKLVQSRVDAETVELLQTHQVNIPELIRRACARAARQFAEA